MKFLTDCVPGRCVCTQPIRHTLRRLRGSAFARMDRRQRILANVNLSYGDGRSWPRSSAQLNFGLSFAFAVPRRRNLLHHAELWDSLLSTCMNSKQRKDATTRTRCRSIARENRKIHTELPWRRHQPQLFLPHESGTPATAQRTKKTTQRGGQTRTSCLSVAVVGDNNVPREGGTTDETLRETADGRRDV